MKRKTGWMLAIGMCLLAVATNARAETVYVSDVIKLSVRSGPGNEHKSIAVTESGQQLELITPGQEWSLVRLANGAEGYVLARYLTTIQPGRFQYGQLQDKIKALTAQAASLAGENSRLKAENEKLAATVSGGQEQIDSLRSEYETFKQEATDLVGLKAKTDALTAELEQKNKQLAVLEIQSDDVYRTTYLYWFVAGAAVLFAGFLTGYSVKRQRWRSSLS
ncbi:MAG: TIGR04211 family SH3 domain-containing protein [Deltaproteobacteria bacterium]|nr:TIGR04211 family SH3 domain-containing protein [Deltaproteobacteria bacterium]